MEAEAASDCLVFLWAQEPVSAGGGRDTIAHNQATWSSLDAVWTKQIVARDHKAGCTRFDLARVAPCLLLLFVLVDINCNCATEPLQALRSLEKLSLQWV